MYISKLNQTFFLIMHIYRYVHQEFIILVERECVCVLNGVWNPKMHLSSDSARRDISQKPTMFLIRTYNLYI